MKHVARVEKAPLGKWAQIIQVRDHELFSDEPEDVGGDDTGPTPVELAVSALGACTSMTLLLYAERKGIALDDVHVDLWSEGSPKDFKICRRIRLEGTFTEEERTRLLEIAARCPVHRLLSGNVAISTECNDLESAHAEAKSDAN